MYNNREFNAPFGAAFGRRHHGHREHPFMLSHFRQAGYTDGVLQVSLLLIPGKETPQQDIPAN